ncbi:MAG TPA: zf-HC2 domain-containing protein [Candidatus Dormibacteraeota bacterium]
MITCAEAVKELWQYLDQTLEPEAREKVGEHLVFCRQCCGELEFARILQDFLRNSGDVEELPAEVRARLERFVAELAP